MIVYAVGQTGASMVKIGRAADMAKRLRQLRCASPVPLALLGHWRALLSTERGLHDRFAARRRHGEWFDFGDDDPVALISEVLGAPLLFVESPPGRPGNQGGARPRHRPTSHWSTSRQDAAHRCILPTDRSVDCDDGRLLPVQEVCNECVVYCGGRPDAVGEFQPWPPGEGPGSYH